MVTARRRRSGRQALSLWANGVRVGVGRPLSLSPPMEPGALPLRAPALEHYFDNLLPDSGPTAPGSPDAPSFAHNPR